MATLLLIALAVLTCFCTTYAQMKITECHGFSLIQRGPDGYPENMKWGYPMTGLTCSGHLCGELTAQQCTTMELGSDRLDLQGYMCRETEWFSNENGHRGGSQSCPDGHFLESIRCTGAYCDNPFLRCCKPLSKYIMHEYAVHTNWFTTPENVQCPNMHVAIAVNCKKHYCEDLQLTCAPVIPVLHTDDSDGQVYNVPLNYNFSIKDPKTGGKNVFLRDQHLRELAKDLKNSNKNSAKASCWQWIAIKEDSDSQTSLNSGQWRFLTTDVSP